MKAYQVGIINLGIKVCRFFQVGKWILSEITCQREFCIKEFQYKSMKYFYKCVFSFKPDTSKIQLRCLTKVLYEEIELVPRKTFLNAYQNLQMNL